MPEIRGGGHSGEEYSGGDELNLSHEFPCPYCGSIISIPIDLSGGEEQSFVTDCDVCCRPIAISLEISAGAITSFNAVRESD